MILYTYKKVNNEAYAYILEMFCFVDELYLVRGDSYLVRTVVSVLQIFYLCTFPPIQIAGQFLFCKYMYSCLINLNMTRKQLALHVRLK